MVRSSDPIFFPGLEKDLSMKRQMDKNYQDSINILQCQWNQADIDQRFVLGDQNVWNTLFPSGMLSKRKMFNFNLINSMVQMVSGYQRRNRKSSICIPIHEKLQHTADQFTKCLYNVHNQCGAYQIYSDAFEQGALTQGIGLVSIYNDLTDDPVSGNIKMRYIDFKSILIDPYFRKADLSDCRYVWTRQFFDKHEAALLYPDFFDEIMELNSSGFKDDKFYYMPEVYQIQSANLIAVDEYWYLASRQATYIVDLDSNEIQEFEGDKEMFNNIQAMTNGRFKLTKRPKQTVRRCILINDKVLVDEENPYGIDCYPFVPFLGYFTPDTAYYEFKYRGIVRDMRDAQFLFNRRKVADLDILESQQQGLKIKKGALVNPGDSLNSGNGRILAIDPKFQMSDVEQMQIIPPSPTMIQMEEMLSDVLHRISGINEELLGSAVDDKAGILGMLRQGAGLTTLQRLFDQFDESQKQCGNIIIKMIQKNWSYNKVKDVIGEEPSQEFDNKAFFDYGCKIVQGVLTESQQQLEFQQLLYLYELTGNSNPILLNRAIEVSTIQEKDKLLEEMQQAQQAQQQQEQQMQQLQMQQMEIDNQTKISYAHSQQSLGDERLAKIHTDRAVAEDKLSRAEQEDTKSLLNLVKTLKELQGIDVANLLTHVDMLHKINDLEFDKKQEIREENIEQGRMQI